MTVECFEELQAWRHARQLTRLVYEVTKQGSFDRDWGLRNQMQRAAVSIMSNIAEGFESRTDGLFLEFLGRAKGSSGELRSQLRIALDVEYLPHDRFVQLDAAARETSRCISGLMIYLKNNRFPASS